MRRQGLKREVKEICNEQHDQKQIGGDRSGQAAIFRVQLVKSFQGETTVRGGHTCATGQQKLTSFLGPCNDNFADRDLTTWLPRRCARADNIVGAALVSSADRR